MTTTCRNDWIITVEKDLEELEIMVDLDVIQTQSHQQFNTFLKKAVQENTLNYLNNQKSTHTKVLHIRHNTLEIQKYLQPEYVYSIQLSKFIFQARTRMLDLKINYKQMYKNEDLMCPLKCIHLDTQKHLLVCPKIESSLVSTSDAPVYEDLFSEEVNKVKSLANILEEKFRRGEVKQNLDVMSLFGRPMVNQYPQMLCSLVQVLVCHFSLQMIRKNQILVERNHKIKTFSRSPRQKVRGGK